LSEIFAYLKYGVALILFYVGVKMLTAEIYHISTEYSLIIILSILIGSIVLSLLKKKKV
jgi:tellurite resistance protein TerC